MWVTSGLYHEGYNRVRVGPRLEGIGGGSLYRNGGLAKVRPLRRGVRGPAAPPY
jgi:hypothetical protein